MPKAHSHFYQKFVNIYEEKETLIKPIFLSIGNIKQIRIPQDLEIVTGTTEYHHVIEIENKILIFKQTVTDETGTIVKFK